MQYIHSVYVHSDGREKGVFRALFEKLISQAREDEAVKRLGLFVTRTNTKAMAVYERMGMSKMTMLNFHEVDFVLKNVKH